MKVFVCLLIINIVTSTNANTYTYITKDLETAVYASVGYVDQHYVDRWMAEGEAVCRALTHIYTAFASIFRNVEGSKIELIVASTGGKSSAYIYGEAERLGSPSLEESAIPSKIIVIYILNYMNRAAAVREYLEFKTALQKLISAAATHHVDVDVRQFRSVAEGKSTLIPKLDYPHFDKVAMEQDQLDAQYGTIDALHAAVDETVFISSVEFEGLLKDPKIRKVVDGIAESEVKEVTKDNQLLLAISMAQIRIMASRVQAKDCDVLVFCIDNPSGMDECGNWTIDDSLHYPVDFILSRVWHKQLINSAYFLTVPTTLVLDITYISHRLIDALWKIISSDCATTPELEADVANVAKSNQGVFEFVLDENDHNKMVAVY